MQSRDYRDIAAGALLITVGLFVALYASAHYDLGTLRQMGPGMFPTALGYILAGLGVIVLLPALFRGGTAPVPEFRPFIAVLVGVMAFALTVERLGFIPAIFLLTGAAALADNKLGIVGTLVLAAVLSAIAVVVFRLGLGMPIEPIRWPF